MILVDKMVLLLAIIAMEESRVLSSPISNEEKFESFQKFDEMKKACIVALISRNKELFDMLNENLNKEM